MRVVNVATCNLAQWAMDFDGNLQRIRRSIRLAKEQGCCYRLGPELEVCGYGCEDHFLEHDTFLHCWDSLAELLESGDTDGILCDIGMPVMHQNVAYNCRVYCLNGKILLIRPKMFLADDGNYREPRYFSAWARPREFEDHYLPRHIASITGDAKVPFGEAAIATQDTVLAAETCEELFTPNSPHIYLGLAGVEIIGNGSGSHHQLGKLQQRLDLITMATQKGGGIYLYANQQGCDGGRLYFDGCAMIVVNGKIVAMGSQFSLREVEVVTASVDLEEVRSYRGSMASRSLQAAQAQAVPRIDAANFELGPSQHLGTSTEPISPATFATEYSYTREEEIAFGPACWLWDYLRRSGMCGFFLPLSGGADSSATASLVAIMCQLVFNALNCEGDPRAGRISKVDSHERDQILADVRAIVRDQAYVPQSAQDLCNKVLYTCYMGTTNSSQDTKDRAQTLSEEIGSHHRAITIDEITGAFNDVFARDVSPTTERPLFKTQGGTWQENIALQNIQARSRMVMAYFIGQLAIWARNAEANPDLPRSEVPGGALLVLGSANVDEALRGYYTKYDCSAADINPIGGIAKTDLKSFLLWSAENRGFASLRQVVEAPPTAELEPLTENYTQTDEDDMGMTYAELTEYGNLRKIARCGPVAMFEKLSSKWEGKYTLLEVADKVKHFFKCYAINRHKMTTLTPSYHAESYSPDDNRFDLRQFLYPQWTAAFRKIDELVARSSNATEGTAGREESAAPSLSQHTLGAHVASCRDCREAVDACVSSEAGGSAERKRGAEDEAEDPGEGKRARTGPSGRARL